MKLVIQRVTNGSVKVDGAIVGQIGRGLVVLLGIEQGDALQQVHQLSAKLLKVRLWPDLKDPSKQWASSVVDNAYELLVVSQFTLFATFKKPKPDFHQAMGGEVAQQLYDTFVEDCRAGLGKSRVATGVFGAMMQVEILNDGPVTVELVNEPGGNAAPSEKGAAPPVKTASAKVEQTPASANKPLAESSASTRDTSSQLATDNLNSGEGALEELLGMQPYLGGFQPSKKDAEHFARLQRTGGRLPNGSSLPNTARWYTHIESFGVKARLAWS